MELARENKQRQEFRSILFDLAKSQDFLKDGRNRAEMYKRLEELYAKDEVGKRFRHYYSDIFSVLQQVHDRPDEGDITVLGQNLSWIRGNYKPQNYAADGEIIDISDPIKKLYDHVNLDIARILYTDAADRKSTGIQSIEEIQGQIRELQTREKQIESVMEETQNGFDGINKAIYETNEKLNNSQKEYIAILGIFSAVVIAFTGGIAFTTSVLNNIAQASVYRTISVALVIGFVLINALFGLFYYVSLMVKGKRRAEAFAIFLCITNVIILGLLLMTFCAWNNGFVENRNKRIRQNNLGVERTEASSSD